jgi:hypothetical protein
MSAANRYPDATLNRADSTVLYAIAMARTARVPRPIPYLMGLSALAYWVQDWAAGTQGLANAVDQVPLLGGRASEPTRGCHVVRC